MTSMPSPLPPEVEYCARHPEIETGLRCGRCDTLICPQCMVYTPAGVRCPDCAQLRPPPMYEVSFSHYLRAAAVSAALALPLGVIGAILFPPRAGIGFLFFLIALLAGAGAGGLVAEAINRVTRGKRGTGMQLLAASALVGAGLVRVILSDVPWEMLPRDLGGMIMIAFAIISAWGRLR